MRAMRVVRARAAVERRRHGGEQRAGRHEGGDNGAGGKRALDEPDAVARLDLRRLLLPRRRLHEAQVEALANVVERVGGHDGESRNLVDFDGEVANLEHAAVGQHLLHGDRDEAARQPRRVRRRRVQHAHERRAQHGAREQTAARGSKQGLRARDLARRSRVFESSITFITVVRARAHATDMHAHEDAFGRLFAVEKGINTHSHDRVLAPSCYWTSTHAAWL
eukprot:4234562-Pleurochrysis_carterae.AAC.1